MGVDPLAIQAGDLVCYSMDVLRHTILRQNLDKVIYRLIVEAYVNDIMDGGFRAASSELATRSGIRTQIIRYC